MLDASAERRFGPFHVGDYREFQGRRLKIIGRTREALSFTTTPVAFLDYRLAQSLSPAELVGRTTFIVVRLEPWADVAAVTPRDPPPSAVQRRLHAGPSGQRCRAPTGSKAPGWGSRSS